MLNLSIKNLFYLFTISILLVSCAKITPRQIQGEWHVESGEGSGKDISSGLEKTMNYDGQKLTYEFPDDATKNSSYNFQMDITFNKDYYQFTFNRQYTELDTSEITYYKDVNGNYVSSGTVKMITTTNTTSLEKGTYEYSLEVKDKDKHTNYELRLNTIDLTVKKTYKFTNGSKVVSDISDLYADAYSIYSGKIDSTTDKTSSLDIYKMKIIAKKGNKTMDISITYDKSMIDYVYNNPSMQDAFTEKFRLNRTKVDFSL